MFSFPNIITNVVPIIVGGMSVTLAAYITRKYWLEEDINDDDDLVNEVLFFSNQGIACRDHFKKELINKKTCHLENCSYYNLRRMIYYLEKTERTLDICLYLITLFDLSQIVVQAHKRGVKVRIITDEDMANGSGSQVHSFFENGIPVRFRRKCTTLMHHKFVIIDKRLLMTGSLNWTMQALCGNWDNLIITSQRQIVAAFISEYERLWQDMN
ncbi:uncharacterized protein LOC129003110 [Macrosteles quadrilineatus]|uniref:uncharacterized protein LOC129003110 n=1 Tax=Macrosteles quadrilineatus TaxID=74068 RepID=UPI0023E12DA9|nr:uncharacterized protein LOC129003110 [Macrosteles quadrilineatus]